MLELHTATTLPELARALARVLAEPGADPMAPELVAVPSAGMRTWLPLQLSTELGRGGPGRTDGVAANIELPFPAVLRQRVVAAHRAAAGGSADDADPWDLERLVWAVLEECDRGGVPLPPGLSSPGEGASRYSAARQVADLFDRYHLHRPDMVLAWAADRMVDGVGAELAPSDRWQAELWQAVRAGLGASSPPERLADALPRLRSGELEVDLPPRVAAFGMSLLPGGPGFLELAAALGSRRDVHLFVVEPAAVLRCHFPAAASGRAGHAPSGRPGHGAPGAVRRRSRAEVDAGDAVAHPLLRSWGRLHYETASVIGDAVADGTLPRVDDASAPAGDEQPPRTLLAALQAGLRRDLRPSGGLVPGADDDSVRFHACHGAARQVEVLHDTLVGLLTDHPHLQEDDILVVSPDLDTFAPLVEATFGASARTAGAVPVAGPGEHAAAGERATVPVADGAAAPRVSLRYRMSDRSLGTSAPLVGAFQALLELVAGRFDAPSVLDFLSLAPVRRRHGLDEDDLAAITGWALDLNVRWGLDPEHREGHGVPAAITANTWQFGVERLLLGAAVLPDADPSGELSDTLGSVVPHGVEGSDIAVAGCVADVLWRLGRLADQVRRDRPLAEWVDLLVQAVADLLAVPREQQWQLDRLLTSLGGIVESAGDPPSATPLTFVDIRRLVAERLGSLEGRPSFFRGGVTISSLTPLRWIPHRVIIMLGMDAACLSARPPEGDDLAARAPVVGDRDSRSELRQALLETVLSATEHLVVIRDGFDVRTNQEVPAAVAVAELRDAVVATADPEHRDEVARRLEVRHPRQPYDEAYFAAGSGDTGTGPPDVADGRPAVPRSFDLAAGLGALSRRRRATREPDFLAEPLAAPELEVVSLEELRRFFASPIRHFVERRLELRLPRDQDAPQGTLDMKLTGLGGYAAGSRLLARLLAGEEVGSAVATWTAVERRTGTAPPGRLGDAALARIEGEVRWLWDDARELGVRLRPDVAPTEVDVVLPSGVRLLGRLRPGLVPVPGDARPGLSSVAYVKRRAEHELATWVDLAALTLAEPGAAHRAVLATKAASGRVTRDGVALDRIRVTPYELAGDDPWSAAEEALETAVDLYRRGMCEPLPLFKGVSDDLVRRPGSSPEWPGRYPDPVEQLAYGRLDAAQLLGIPVRDDDPPGPAGDRARRFAQHLFGAMDGTLQEVPHDR